MKIEYKRDMNHNYLILHGDNEIDTSSYQVRMLVGNVIPSLLKCRIQGMDGKFMVYYDITSRQSLSAFYEKRKLRQEEIKLIFSAFVRVMEDTAEYLMNPEQLVISPDLIFMEADKKVLYFCLLPGYQKDVRKQLQALAEYILPKIDHEDEEAVKLGYGVYRRTLEDSFHLEHIKEELYRVRTEEHSLIFEKKQEVYETEEKDRGPYDTNYDRKEDRKESTRWNDQREELNFVREGMEDDRECNSKGKKAGKAILAGLLFLVTAGGIIAAKILGYLPQIGMEVMLGAAIAGTGMGMLVCLGVKKIKERDKKENEENHLALQRGRHPEYKEKSYGCLPEEEPFIPSSANRNILKSGEAEKKITYTSVSKEETLLNKGEYFGETVVLSAITAPGPSSLVSHEPGELAAIYLQEDITVIGKLENACDAVIDLPTVSRIHAKIRKRDNEYYLSDLNSRNGTSVNGRLLRPDEEYKLENEDQVDFAQARYIFVSGQ